MTECPTGKRSYASKQAARKALRNHRGSLADLRCYQCDVCAAWHCGHREKAIDKPLRTRR